jgi:hypothetical protein
MNVCETLLTIGVATICAAGFTPAFAAENLRLAPGVSYNSDLGTTFPIAAEKLDDVSLDPTKPSLIFFGATGDLNTNRQAKRLVELYKKEHDKSKFIVVNVDNPINESARRLIRQHYPGYVPAQLLVNPSGKVIWSQVGEVSRRKLRGQIYNTM